MKEQNSLQVVEWKYKFMGGGSYVKFLKAGFKWMVVLNHCDFESVEYFGNS